MVRNLLMVLTLVLGALIVGVVSNGSVIVTGAMAWGAEFAGPGPASSPSTSRSRRIIARAGDAWRK
jgi:hypothetical protein